MGMGKERRVDPGPFYAYHDGRIHQLGLIPVPLMEFKEDWKPHSTEDIDVKMLLILAS